MEALTDEFGNSVTVLCHACGAMVEHHQFVKPRSPFIGLICARCGNIPRVV